MKQKLKIKLCSPHGFCAGVERAIQIVVLALKKYGPPVYVRHEIVHNRFVVRALEQKGAIFIEELSEITPHMRDRPVIFSAHGVAKQIYQNAEENNLFYVDATCPLVSKVHKQAMKHQKAGRHILLIGHQGHPEVVGTMGQVCAGDISLIENLEDAENFVAPFGKELGYLTQTTLSVEDASNIIAVLKRRFPQIVEPAVESICYATTNRQNAVKKAALGCDLFIILGSVNSSNSKRLVEVAAKSGVRNTLLIDDINDIKWDDFINFRVVGISAGASAPQILFNELVDEFERRFDLDIEIVETAKEDQKFLLSKELRDVALSPKDMEFLNGKC